MQLEILVMSKKGGRERNEDACGVWSSPKASFCVLSDGLGGHSGGEVASKLVVSRVLEWFRSEPPCHPQAIAGALGAAHVALLDEQARVPEMRDMGATVVVLALDTVRRAASWGHLGDSRLYCFREARIAAKTRDDSLIQEMVDARLMTAGEVRDSPHRSKLLAAMGAGGSAMPHFHHGGFPIRHGDVFLLCSDGLWEYVEDEEMEQSLAASESAGEWLRTLEGMVVARGRKAQDNYSAIAVWCRESAQTTDEDITLSGAMHRV